jgi:hypothetical protein
MALTAMGLLFASACGQDDEPSAATGDRLTPAANSEAAGSARNIKATAEPAQQEGTTTTTAAEDNVDADETDQTTTSTTSTTRPSPPAEPGGGPTEVCEGSGADIAPIRGRTGDAPADCIELGTGDVQVTLRWASEADIDLHVTEPDGTEIWYGDKGPTATGGQLDVDSNVGCVQEASVENVFWPTGRAPSGSYTIEVTGYQVDGCGSGDYTVSARVRGEQVLLETGSVGEDETDTYEIEA